MIKVVIAVRRWRYKDEMKQAARKAIETVLTVSNNIGVGILAFILSQP